MKRERITEGSPWNDPRGQVMKTPGDVGGRMRLRACGWGVKRIARQLGCSHHTVKDYVATGGVRPFKSPERPKRLVVHHSDFDVLIPSHSRMGKFFGGRRISMLRGTPG